MKFCHEILETLSYHMVKTRSLYLTWSYLVLKRFRDVRDTRTDKRTDVRDTNDASYASSRK